MNTCSPHKKTNEQTDKEKTKNIKNESMITIKTTEFLNFDDTVINIQKPKNKFLNTN